MIEKRRLYLYNEKKQVSFGWLISEKKAAEKKAAEKIIVWELSEAEREAVRRISLDKNV